MSLREWDMGTAPLLRQIEVHSRVLGTHARSIIGCIRSISLRPGWTTRAEHELEQTEKELDRALRLIREARKEFAEKPKEQIDASV